MSVTLGIDTGGTYTDAVLVDQADQAVLCSAKSLTTYGDLSQGIGLAMDAVLNQPACPGPGSISLVGLSTTLATNAIVENRGGRIALVLIGYDPEVIRSYGFSKDLVAEKVIYVRGGHDQKGDEVHPLDMEGLKAELEHGLDQVEGFGVTGYFSVRNPSHERAAREMIRKMTGLPVTCGHELTHKLDSVRRATTVALNARLIVLIRELIEAVTGSLAERCIRAPLMVVRGDGSLVDATWAIHRPIETILSGPAASVIGAGRLAGEEIGRDRSLWVMDMGGTTTDVAFLDQGIPRPSPEGARVGGWRTMIEAVDVQTAGLGGDSQVCLEPNKPLQIGPRRVVPLCQLAHQRAEIIGELERQVKSKPDCTSAAVFVLPVEGSRRRLTDWESGLLTRLSDQPISLNILGIEAGPTAVNPRMLQHAFSQRLIGLAGFTPTDALHALGRLELWPARASQLAAKILADHMHLSPDEFCLRVVEGVSFGLAREMVTAAMTADGVFPDWDEEPAGMNLLVKALSERPGLNEKLGCAFKLAHPLVAIGAPVQGYARPMAQRLNTRLIIPEFAEVANAVGAAVSGVMLRRTVEIRPLPGSGRYRLHLDDGVHDFDELDAAVHFATERVTVWLNQQAEKNRAHSPKISIRRHDTTALAGSAGDEVIYLGTDLYFLACGQPRSQDDTAAVAMKNE